MYYLYIIKSDMKRVIYKKTIFSFILAFLVCTFAGIITIQNKINIEKLQIEHLILESSYRINEVISHKLYKTQALAALVIKGDGVVNNFQEIAAVIVSDEPSLANVLLAPDGIVTDVYPLEESRAVLGLDFFNDTFAGNREAILARDTGQLVMAGPFLLRQGHWGLAGRYPVYINTETEKNKFWGLVSVSLKFPEALDDTGISLLEHQGFSYELWRINPDTNDKQVIATGKREFYKNAPYVEKQIRIHNADWYFRIFPIRSWYQFTETWLLMFAGLCISTLLAFLVQKNIILNITKSDLQKLNQVLHNNAAAKEMELTENKISIMLSQIKPHFLYNSLTAIRELCRSNPEMAEQTVIEFSDYLRGNLDSLTTNELIPFEQELKHVQTYLAIEKKRFEDKFNITYNIKTMGFYLPALTLQPIVENAVCHGIINNKFGGTVTITTEKSEDSIIITVTDDGAGFDYKNIYNENEQKEGRKKIGIKNVLSRLNLMCNGSLEIQSTPGEGTTAVIRLPINDE